MMSPVPTASLFPTLVKEHFRYLTDELGYSLVAQHVDEVKFRSSSCHVRVILDRTQVFVDVGPVEGPAFESKWLDMQDIIHARDPASSFQYSFDPAAYERTPRGVLNHELARLARTLRQCCSDILSGDFSASEQVREYVKRRRAADPFGRP